MAGATFPPEEEEERENGCREINTPLTVSTRSKEQEQETKNRKLQEAYCDL